MCIYIYIYIIVIVLVLVLVLVLVIYDLNHSYMCTYISVCEHDEAFANSIREAFAKTKRSRLSRKHHKPSTSRSKEAGSSWAANGVL